MESLMHSTLEEIATHIRTIELPAPMQQPETESFFEDSTWKNQATRKTKASKATRQDTTREEDPGQLPDSPNNTTTRSATCAANDWDTTRQGGPAGTPKTTHGQQRSWQALKQERLEHQGAEETKQQSRGCSPKA
ncbi:hypothetical protein P3342_004759 [Pyrenophora teres f. teres]|nr:hypothetical protein P3342_004759 [Pyrenophora teres f. teres]